MVRVIFDGLANVWTSPWLTSVAARIDAGVRV
jgi:hypothetical protein